MHAYVKTTVLMFTLGLASAVPVAGEGGNSTSAASTSTASTSAASTSTASTSTALSSAKRTGGGMYGIYRSAPELDPTRRISEQDCTKPIVYDAGNLRCK